MNAEPGAIRTYRQPLRRIPLSWAVSRVLAASLVVAVLLIAGLSIQMSLGKDPSLGPKLAAVRGSGSTGTSQGTGGGTDSVQGSPLQALITGETGESEEGADDDVPLVQSTPAAPSTPSVSQVPVAPAPAPVVTATS